MQVCDAHSPHQTPLASLYLIRDNRNCPERSDHEWPCLPLDLEEAAATSVFPLGLLAPAACRVPGGLIKFDLFFFFFFSVKVYHLHLRRLGGLSPVLYGLGESRTASPRVPSCVQSRGRRRGGGEVFLSCRSAGGGHPRLLPRCSGPEFILEVPPEPPPFCILGAGAEPPREECVNFLTGGSCPRPEWAVFRRGTRGALGFVYE